MNAKALVSAIDAALRSAMGSGTIPAIEVPIIELSRPARPEYGDWSCQIALALASRAKMKPRDVAEAIKAALPASPDIESVEIAGPGFLNFRLSHDARVSIVRDIIQTGASYGRVQAEHPERVQVEFVSANPTGPLHVGHGRWAVLGDSIGTLLEAAGHQIQREFYVNDFGNQMDLFARSIQARIAGDEVPEGGYVGAYISDLAQQIVASGTNIDDLAALREEGRDRMIAGQRSILERLSVRFDTWFSETALHDGGAVERAIETVKERGHAFTEDGALWLRTTDFGDDKDRVVVRANGEPTYFASDIAYYLDKRSRGFERIVYLWGADHHGYVPRMRAAIQCLGDDPDTVEFLIGQLVSLKRGGEPVRMSKRTGEMVTFEELLDEVGADGARYTFLRSSLDRSVDFDIEVVVSRSQDNPVYYVQYAHARICSIIAYAIEQGVQPVDDVDLSPLVHASEMELIKGIDALPDTVAAAARHRAPNALARYAEDLAGLFHGFYRDCRVVTEDAALTQARLQLCRATRITLANALALLGVSAPEKM